MKECNVCWRPSEKFVCDDCRSHSLRIQNIRINRSYQYHKDEKIRSDYKPDLIRKYEKECEDYRLLITPWIEAHKRKIHNKNRQEYRDNNPDKVKEIAAKYRANNKDKIKARNAQYYFMKKIGLIAK